MIVSVDAEPLDLDLTEPFGIATGAPTRARNVLVKVVLKDGTVGLGESAPFTEVSGETQEQTIKAINAMAPMVVGHDAKNWESIGSELREKHLDAPAARCGVEIAVIDALARSLSTPLWKTFGGAGTKLETDMTVTTGDVAHARTSAKNIIGRGISTIKVKIAAASAEEDVARLAAIRETAPQARLFADANSGYDLDEALRFITGIEAHGIPLEIFEQPLARGAHDAWDELAAKTRIPLCADESARSVADVRELAQKRAVRFVKIKTMKYGVAEAYAMMREARASGLGLMIGGMVESILAMSFSAHLAAGFGGLHFVDLDTPMFIREHPFVGGFAQNGGHLDVGHIDRGHGVTLA
jgi:L-alanine-DL-glutamate epimerase-like enolase superfamily enzyme